MTQGRREATALEEGIQGRDIRVLHKDTMNSAKSEVEGPEGIIMQHTSTANSMDGKAPKKDEKDGSSNGGALSLTMADLPSVNG